MSETDDRNPKINLKGWSRRDFLKYSLQLGALSQAWAAQEALAKPTYNFAFWQSRVSTTILQVSEMSAAIALTTAGGVLGISEVSASIITKGPTDSVLAISEENASIACSEQYIAKVSELCVMVLAKL